MTGVFWLDWATLAVSVLNTMLLLWLGLTVLLNAERLTGGILLSSSGLLLGSAFFFSHTAILGYATNLFGPGLDFWWRLGWIPVTILPFGWYAIVLWYSGFWEIPRPELYQRQILPLIVTSLLTASLVLTLVLANPLPSFAEASNLHLQTGWLVAGVPPVILLFLLDIFLSVALSLDALLRPAPSPRLLGSLARNRARPWLVAAGMVLILVGILVAAIVLWVLHVSESGAAIDRVLLEQVAMADLGIASLITACIFLVGQAVARYEVFTGKALPRQGLLRHWHNAIVLAGGFSVLVATALAIQLRPIYSLLASAGLLTVFYALFAWRALGERDRYMQQLRPFVKSQRLYDQLLEPDLAPAEVDARGLLSSLARDLLGVSAARLLAVGPLAALVSPLAYPDAAALSFPLPISTAGLTPAGGPLSLDPMQSNGARWAVGLWSERGMDGILLVGDKTDGGVLAQEEIDIARASGERLLDAFAGAELARRLMALQRERLAESALVDARARRVLHDQVLPQLHSALLTASAADENGEVVSQLTSTHRQISELLRSRPGSASDVSRAGLLGALERCLEEEWEGDFARIDWEIQPGVREQLASLSMPAAETLYYAAREVIRNSARHAHGSDRARAVSLTIRARCGDDLQIEIEDDGVGLDRPPGGSSPGSGLALHSAMLAVVGGTLALGPHDPAGTRVTLTLPKGALQSQDPRG